MPEGLCAGLCVMSWILTWQSAGLGFKRSDIHCSFHRRIARTDSVSFIDECWHRSKAEFSVFICSAHPRAEWAESQKVSSDSEIGFSPVYTGRATSLKGQSHPSWVATFKLPAVTLRWAADKVVLCLYFRRKFKKILVRLMIDAIPIDRRRFIKKFRFEGRDLVKTKLINHHCQNWIPQRPATEFRWSFLSTLKKLWSLTLASSFLSTLSEEALVADTRAVFAAKVVRLKSCMWRKRMISRSKERQKGSHNSCGPRAADVDSIFKSIRSRFHSFIIFGFDVPSLHSWHSRGFVIVSTSPQALNVHSIHTSIRFQGRFRIWHSDSLRVLQISRGRALTFVL